MVTKSNKRSKASNRGNTAAKKPLPSTPTQPANDSGPPPSNLDMLRRMYAAMVKCRMVGERVRDGNAMVAYDLTTGHEAVVVGASIDLEPEDTIAASHRNFAARIAMGTALKHLLKEATANNSDECRASVISCRRALPGLNSSAVFLADPFNLATGVALTHKLEKRTNVVVAFWDEDAASLEASHEALKFAGIHKLPIIYVTRSAGLDDLGSRKHSALEEFSFLAKDYGFPSILVDGKDVVAVWRGAQESIHRARNGSGPTLIECQTEAANFKDPLAHMQHYMSRRGAWEDRWKRQIVARINAEIGEAMRQPGS
jgi:acetoin:2,6-dichlorophenolindophenol oxidoreductase subunit alpha